MSLDFCFMSLTQFHVAIAMINAKQLKIPYQVELNCCLCRSLMFIEIEEFNNMIKINNANHIHHNHLMGTQ